MVASNEMLRKIAVVVPRAANHLCAIFEFINMVSFLTGPEWSISLHEPLRRTIIALSPIVGVELRD